MIFHLAPVVQKKKLIKSQAFTEFSRWDFKLKRKCALASHRQYCHQHQSPKLLRSSIASVKHFDRLMLKLKFFEITLLPECCRCCCCCFWMTFLNVPCHHNLFYYYPLFLQDENSTVSYMTLIGVSLVFCWLLNSTNC